MVRVIDHIRVDRLTALYDAWGAMGIRKPRSFAGTSEQPQHLLWHERKRTYHKKRILFFLNHPDAEPIEVDNICSHGLIYPLPIIIDGHHRLCAAILANRKTIPVCYSGRIDLLNWLKGKRKTLPVDPI